ncbi:MAG: hypothetical protein RH860_04860 [Cytophagales bacterium]
MNTKLINAILISSVFTLLYAVLPPMDLPYSIVFFAFIIANVLLFRMVYVILKFGKESTKTFQDHFYDDIESKRNNS